MMNNNTYVRRSISYHPNFTIQKNDEPSLNINYIKDSIYYTLLKLALYDVPRRLLVQKIKKGIYEAVMGDSSENLQSIQFKKYLYFTSMLDSVIRNVEKGYISLSSFRQLLEIFVGPALIKPQLTQKTARHNFRQHYGIFPPDFVMISPTKPFIRGNNNPGTEAIQNVSLNFNVFDRIVNEVRNRFGSRFIVINGDEPFLYKDNDKSIFDIFKQYNDMFFLVFTNGTLISAFVAEKLAELGNVSPVIRVEGFAEETDAKRGENTFNKIEKGLAQLRKVGVPFGISIMATSRNVNVLLKDDFYDYYFDKLGATYMWQSQFKHACKGKDSFSLMVNPSDRIKLFRMWEELLRTKKYCITDFCTSGVLSDGCMAYGRKGGYIHIDWNGNITPCNFIPYSSDNIYDLYSRGRSLCDALFSKMMKNGREWQYNYGLKNKKLPENWLMPCSIDDHYEYFRTSVLTGKETAVNEGAGESLDDENYRRGLAIYTEELKKYTDDIWNNEFLYCRVRQMV